MTNLTNLGCSSRQVSKVQWVELVAKSIYEKHAGLSSYMQRVSQA